MAETRTPRRGPGKDPQRTPPTTRGGDARHWTDWINIIAGIWLAISPWVVATGLATAGSWNVLIMGIVITIVALFGFSDVRAEWVNVAAAVWLFFSPWLLGYAQVAPNLAWNSWIVSVIVFLVALAGATRAGERFVTTRA